MNEPGAVVSRTETLDESGWDFATKKLLEGERLIRAGKVRRGLKSLHDAVYNVRASTSAYETVFEHIREAAEAAAQADNGRHALPAERIARIADQQEAGVRQILAFRPAASTPDRPLDANRPSVGIGYAIAFTLATLVLGFFGFLTGAVLAWGGYLPGPVSPGLLGWALIFSVLLPTLFIGGLYLLGRRS